MPVDRKMSSSGPMCCERCGSILAIFEEQDDGRVIFCVCRCLVESRAAEESPRLCHRCGNRLEIFREWEHGETIYLACECAASPASPDSARETGAVKGARRCQSCGAMLVLVGTRPDGAPIEAECPCQRAERSDHERRPRSHEAPIRIQRREQRRPDSVAVRECPALPTESAGRRWMMGGVLALVVATAMAGFWARGRGNVTAPPGPAKPIPRSEVTPTQEDKAPPSLPPGGVEIRNDDSGAVTFVSGTDPSAVLRAFCRHPQFKSALVPGTLQSTTPPDPDLLVGSAVLMDGAGTQHQVILKRNPETKRWSIGDGKSVIALASPVP